jgi:hypothetical protein
MRFLKFNGLLLAVLSLFCLRSSAQTSGDQKKAAAFALLKSRIESKQFRFKAQSATTQRGKTINLTTEYFLEINNDSLSVNLPYYGRSYSMSYPSDDLGLVFNTKQFSYQADTLKKSGWNIAIQPKNAQGANNISLNITSSGYCVIRVSSNYRDMISFYGTITEYGMR